jgi:hypothetical protein
MSEVTRSKGMEKKLIQFTDELWEVLDFVRRHKGRAAWMEDQLWRMTAIKRAASEMGIQRSRRQSPGPPYTALRKLKEKPT